MTRLVGGVFLEDRNGNRDFARVACVFVQFDPVGCGAGGLFEGRRPRFERREADGPGAGCGRECRIELRGVD